MTEAWNHHDHATGDTCPDCEGQLVLLVSVVGGEVLECECGAAGVLVAA